MTSDRCGRCGRIQALICAPLLAPIAALYVLFWVVHDLAYPRRRGRR